MNTLQRPLFDAPMPMVEGSGITSMAMDEAAGEQIGAELTAAIAQGVADTETAIDAADDNVGIMNALRGKQASEEEYRTELAGYVGRKDANATPDSVLALVQPTIAMIELGDAPMGGIADMMPPQTFGVEEEVFGKLPVQKLQEGGLAGTIGQIQQLQQQFLPSEEDISKAFAVQQPTTAQSLLSVGAPFVQGLLAPQGGINAALAAASRAASQQLASQREAEQQSKRQIAQALINQRMEAGQAALTAGLEIDQKEKDRITDLLKARIAAGAKGKGTKKELQELSELSATLNPNSQLYKDVRARIDYLTQKDTDETTATQLGSLNNYAANKLKKYENFQANVVRNLRIMSQLDQAYDLAKKANIQPGTDIRRNTLNFLTSVGNVIPGSKPITDRLRVAVGGKNLSDDDLRKAFESGYRALQAQQTLNFVELFPGNLNEREVTLSETAASGKELTPPQIEQIRETIKKRLRLERDFANAYARAEEKFDADDNPNKGLYDLYKMIQTEVRGVINVQTNEIFSDEGDPANVDTSDTDASAATEPAQLFGTGRVMRPNAIGAIFESAQSVARANQNQFTAKPNTYLSDVTAQRLALETAIEKLEPSNKRYQSFDAAEKRAYLQQIITALQTEGDSDFAQNFQVGNTQAGMFSVATAIRVAKLMLEEL